jgi:hypothetical protein
MLADSSLFAGQQAGWLDDSGCTKEEEEAVEYGSGSSAPGNDEIASSPLPKSAYEF